MFGTLDCNHRRIREPRVSHTLLQSLGLAVAGIGGHVQDANANIGDLAIEALAE
mgnify:CR=1 FL=1